jgi:hypothetical protein
VNKLTNYDITFISTNDDLDVVNVELEPKEKALRLLSKDNVFNSTTNPFKKKGIAADFLKGHLIAAMAELRDVPFFVETGTYLADTLLVVSPCFLYNWSVEGKKDFYRHSRVRTTYPIRKNVKILLGDSPDILPQILSEVDEYENTDKRCIFFLDAHYSGKAGISSDPDNLETDTYISEKYDKCPLLQEIEQIKSHDCKDHLVLIDDIRMCSTPGWPTIEELLDSLLDLNPKFSFKYSLQTDILIAGVFK